MLLFADEILRNNLAHGAASFNSSVSQSILLSLFPDACVTYQGTFWVA